MKLSQVLKSCEATRQRERERISKTLHDHTGGDLMAVATQLELLRMDGVKGLEPSIEALERALATVRTLSADVHPYLVERVGLARALWNLVNTSKRRFAGSFQVEIAEPANAPSVMYRIAEELLDNAIRHSNASTIFLSLTSAGDLIVKDDGVGFARSSEASGLGLWRVRLWAQNAGLRVGLRSAPESGTIIRVTQSHAI